MTPQPYRASATVTTRAGLCAQQRMASRSKTLTVMLYCDQSGCRPVCSDNSAWLYVRIALVVLPLHILVCLASFHASSGSVIDIGVLLGCRHFGRHSMRRLSVKLEFSHTKCGRRRHVDSKARQMMLLAI